MLAQQGLRALMLESNCSYTEIALEADVTESYVRQVLAGYHRARPATIAKIERAIRAASRKRNRRRMAVA